MNRQLRTSFPRSGLWTAPLSRSSVLFGVNRAQKGWYSSEAGHPQNDHAAPANPHLEKREKKREAWKLDISKWEEAEEKDAEIDSRVVGLERIEALGLGEQFSGETILTGPFGTKDDPVIVHSYFNSRIVGCQGGPGDLAHEVLWHEVRRNKPLVCLECGQFFVLQPHPLKELTEEMMREVHTAGHNEESDEVAPALLDKVKKVLGDTLTRVAAPNEDSKQ